MVFHALSIFDAKVGKSQLFRLLTVLGRTNGRLAPQFRGIQVNVKFFKVILVYLAQSKVLHCANVAST